MAHGLMMIGVARLPLGGALRSLAALLVRPLAGR